MVLPNSHLLSLLLDIFNPKVIRQEEAYLACFFNRSLEEPRLLIISRNNIQWFEYYLKSLQCHTPPYCLHSKTICCHVIRVSMASNFFFPLKFCIKILTSIKKSDFHGYWLPYNQKSWIFDDGLYSEKQLNLWNTI